MQRKQNIALAVFLAIQSILYYFILTAGGQALVVTSYLAIVLCFLFSLQGIRFAPFVVGGLACTAGADFCLVICDPIQQLWGMVFFLGAQSLYAFHLHRSKKNNILLLARIILTAAAVILTFAFLREKADALAVISVAYYANLIMNIIAAFSQWNKNKLLPIAFVLFLLCDTIIGLQVAAGGYLPIPEDSWLHNLLFNGFNTSWMFYLPSQVLIARNCLPKGVNNGAKKKAD